MSEQGRMSAEQTPDIERVLAEHRLTTPVQCRCGWRENDPMRHLPTHESHVVQALAPVLAAAVREAEQRALREAAAWIGDSLGYPVQVAMPDHPMPDALWEALVDHVHADHTGDWHDNELSRDETAAWLAEEAGRADRVAEPQHEAATSSKESEAWPRALDENYDGGPRGAQW